MPLLFVLLAFLTAFAPPVWAYDPPEVIGEFSDNPYGMTCISDQNGDGRAELLIPHFSEWRLEVFFGSNDMGPDFNLSINLQHDSTESLRGIGWLGNISPNHTNIFATQMLRRSDRTYFLDFYQGFSDRDQEPWTIWTTEESREAWRVLHNIPIDFNGDGFDDVIYTRGDDSLGTMEILWGGQEFDSIPDWISTFGPPAYTSSFIYSTGFDVNADGYEDILIQGMGQHEEVRQEYFYALFLGGADPDTNPALFFWNQSFPGAQFPVRMERGFALLPDVNDDGYDDFGIYYQDRFIIPEEELVYYWDGIYLFFGGEEVDGEPDMILAGAQRGEAGAGKLVGGDFNGDGIGDIAASYTSNSPPGNEEFHYHFGSAYLDTLPDMIFSSNDLGDQYGSLWDPGAVGDYNGDGADDVAITTSSDIRLIILAGNPGWRVGIEDEPKAVPQEFFFELSPNPFNGELTITCKLTKPGSYELRVFDVAGREIETLFKGVHSVGSLNTSWRAQQAGIYFFDFSSEDGRRVVKKAVCLK